MASRTTLGRQPSYSNVVISDGAHAATKVAIGVAVLNRMLDRGRPNSVRIA